MIVEVAGLVTRVRGRDFFTYSVHDGERSTEFSSRVFVQPGESVRAACEMQERVGKQVLVAEKVEKTADIYGKVEEKLRAGAKLRESARLAAGSELAKIKPDLENVARKLYAASDLGRFVTVKFHGDADGISSALMVRKFLRANYLQQNSAIYSVGDAIRDIEKLGQQFRPMLVLLDFGSGDDSAEGLRLANAGGIEIVSVDHHPPGEKPGVFSASANPWNSGIENGSDYPAGILCAALIQLFGLESDGLEKLACAGDKSPVEQISESEREKALVLDFVATYSGFGNGIDFYMEVLENKGLFDSILHQAHAKMEELDVLLEKSVKKVETPKALVCIVNLDGLSEKREFPTKGKIASRVFEKYKDNGPVFVMGFGKRSVIFRLNDSAVANGLRADEIIKRMRTNFSDFVDNGGGHARAAALRIKEGFESAAVDEIVKMVKER